MKNANKADVNSILVAENIAESLVKSALIIKNASSEIDVKIHAAGIMLSLPMILEKDEVVHSLSLGAGNTGKQFDLETNFRVAEFKFINWRGGAESIRQNGLFKDYFNLEAHETDKEKCMYLTGSREAISFLNGKRSLESVLSKDNATRNRFFSKHGDKYKVVQEYYHDVKSIVTIIDLKDITKIFDMP